MTLITIVFLCCVSISFSLDIAPNSLEGTENNPDGFTDKQLAILRWFASLTYLNQQDDPSGDGWTGYEEYPSQLSNNALRYQLAHLAYAVATTTYYKTPAYTELAGNILQNAVDRMIDYKVWAYVKTYWVDAPTYPDPVALQNIMYSGHLAQMIALYESITGDFTRYSSLTSFERDNNNNNKDNNINGGWYFASQDTNTSIYYNTAKLLNAILVQQDKDYTGGVCCEPHGIFVICNNFQHNAFVLYDALHSTNFSWLNEKWRNFVFSEGRLPEIFSNGDRYLRIVQAQYPPLPRFWEPLGAAGNDGWALSYMLPWWKTNGHNSSFVCEGWKCMEGTRMWNYENSTGGYYISDEWIGHQFDFNDEFTTSYYPLVESQCNQYTPLPLKSLGVYTHFEKRYGYLFDPTSNYSSGPASGRTSGIQDAYCYNTGKSYRILENANLLMSMILNGLGEDGLVNVFQKPLIFLEKGNPYLKSVNYPTVMVPSAIFSLETFTLKFSLKSNDGNCHENEVAIIGNVGENVSVFKNGIPVNQGISFMNGNLFVTVTVCGKSDIYEVK